MRPWRTVASAQSPDGDELRLQERDGTWVIRVGGVELMSSARHRSEEAMAEAGLSAACERVLIGGLGFGFTLGAALARLPAKAAVTVAELSPAVVEWNRGVLAPLAGAPLTDPRVEVVVDDVARVLDESPARFDAILLDVDNGPSALTQKKNARLYGAQGLASARRALRPGGRLVVWSAGPDARFLARLEEAGFAAHAQKVARDCLFVAAATSSSPRSPRRTRR